MRSPVSARGSAGRPPMSPPSPIDLRVGEEVPLSKKSASLGGYLNQEQLRALLQSSLPGTSTEQAASAQEPSKAEAKAQRPVWVDVEG